VQQIDEVKSIHSRKLEMLNAVENERIIAEKQNKARKQNLMEIKQDFQEELKLLEDIKQRQVLEQKRFEQRKEAYNVLTHQIGENNIKRIKETEEKEKEQRHMRLH